MGSLVKFTNAICNRVFEGQMTKYIVFKGGNTACLVNITLKITNRGL